VVAWWLTVGNGLEFAPISISAWWSVCADLEPGLAVLDDLGLGLGFCAADLGLGWWSSGMKPDLDRNS
jgi:hypothetical protein